MANGLSRFVTGSVSVLRKGHGMVEVVQYYWIINHRQVVHAQSVNNRK